MINVTKPFLPPKEEYIEFLNSIWDNNWLTNNGPLLRRLEEELKIYCDVPYIQFTVNGTVPLQLAIKALELKGEVITTPFSYVATTGAILWENCSPVFVDIEPRTFCIDAEKIEAAITENTSAILATHVYGFPCDVIRIQEIARKHNLKVIFDGAHAFGVRYKGKSIFEYGDISTCSFHATKLFHTIEGGAVFCNTKSLDEKIFLYKAFGHIDDNYLSIGINGKNSEFHAAMGLCNLKRVGDFITARKRLAEHYKEELSGLNLEIPRIPDDTEYNYAYFPVIFRDEKEVLRVKEYLAENKVNTRRYFYPSLNTLPYLTTKFSCPVSESIARRVLCLPFYQQLKPDEVSFITALIKKVLIKEALTI
jgi:dTDP-4-amino-4,6-dideoxygalactose transaminase